MIVYRSLLAVVLIAYLVFALEPFQWQPPRKVDNGATVDSARTIKFDRPGMVHSTGPPKWIAFAKEKNSFVLRLTVRSYSTNQTGPARIFSVSRDEHGRNLTIAQQNSDLVVRLRRGNSYDGKPEYVVPAVFSDKTERELELSVEPTSVVIRCDNQLVLMEPLVNEPLQFWNPHMRLALGNEFSGNRPWLGELSRVVIRVAGQEFDPGNADLQIPDSYYSDLQQDFFVPLSDSTFRNTAFREILINLLCFLPVGYLVAKSSPYRSLLLVIAICAMASLVVEMMQIFFGSHSCSLVDFAANCIGGGTGGYTAMAGGSRSGVREPLTLGIISGGFWRQIG